MYTEKKNNNKTRGGCRPYVDGRATPHCINRKIRLDARCPLVLYRVKMPFGRIIRAFPIVFLGFF